MLSYCVTFALAFAPRPRVPAPPPSTLQQQAMATFGAAAVLLTTTTAALPFPALAEEAPMTVAQCGIECNDECNKLAPGNKDYCATQCTDFCDNLSPDQLAKGSAAGGDGASPSAAAATKDCSGYKTDAARAWCGKENDKAVAATLPQRKQDNGIFGDSGVSYSKGVEDLFATAFGATRQNQNVKEADVGAFAGDIGNAAAKAVFGK